jgi:uncharacterized protein (DUF58 family)
VASAARQSLDRRRVYIFPTRHGLMLSSMMLVILLGSINYDNALGYLLSFLLFGLFLISVLQTYRNLTGLSFLGAEIKPTFAGTPAKFQLALENDSNWERFSVVLAHWPRLQSRWGRRRSAPPSSRIDVVPPVTIMRTKIAVAAPQRGWLGLQRVRISSVFPLGILRAWGYFETHAACLVYPQPIGSLSFPRYESSSHKSDVGNSQGSDDFTGFQLYRAGDPIRAIAWKNLARQETILVKRFSGGGKKRVWLQWRDTHALIDTELRLSQLTHWVLEAEGMGVHYGFAVGKLVLEPNSGASHRHQCLQALALYALP